MNKQCALPKAHEEWSFDDKLEALALIAACCGYFRAANRIEPDSITTDMLARCDAALSRTLPPIVDGKVTEAEAACPST